MISASAATAVEKRLRPTGRPSHAAGATRAIETDERDVDDVDARRDLVVELTAPERRPTARG